MPLDDVALQEIFYAYSNPSKIEDNQFKTPWIEWVYKLRKPDHRHALEFVENWDGTRIAIAGILPWLFSMIIGVVWSAKGGDVQTAFTVAGFILTSGTRMLWLQVSLKFHMLIFINSYNSTSSSYQRYRDFWTACS